MIIIWTNFVGPTTSMLYTKVISLLVLEKIFTIYGHGCYYGHVISTIWTNFNSPEIWAQLAQWFQRRCLKMLMDGRWSHWYTIISPMSLQLRWAKNSVKFWSRRRCHLTTVIYSSSGPFVQRTRCICAIYVKGILRKHSVNLDQWFRRKCHLNVFQMWSPGSPLFSGVEPFVLFW